MYVARLIHLNRARQHQEKQQKRIKDQRIVRFIFIFIHNFRLDVIFFLLLILGFIRFHLLNGFVSTWDVVGGLRRHTYNPRSSF